MQGVWLHLESRGGTREAVDGTIHKDNMKRIKFRRFTLIEQVRRGSGEKRFRVKARILGFVWVTLADFKTHREAEAYIRYRADEVSGATISSYYQELPARMPYMDTYLLSYIVCESGRITKHVEKYSTGWEAMLHKWIAEKFEKEKRDVSLFVETIKLRDNGSKKHKKN